MVLSAEECNMRLDDTGTQIKVVELVIDFETAIVV